MLSSSPLHSKKTMGVGKNSLLSVNDINICKPLTPVNLQAFRHIFVGQKKEIYMSWDIPKREAIEGNN